MFDFFDVLKHHSKHIFTNKDSVRKRVLNTWCFVFELVGHCNSQKRLKIVQKLIFLLSWRHFSVIIVIF